jgi:hypothetical protein
VKEDGAQSGELISRPWKFSCSASLNGQQTHGYAVSIWGTFILRWWN